MRHIAFVLLAVALCAPVAGAQTANPPGVTLSGAITTQAGSVLLPGVAISVADESSRVVAETTSGEQGQFSVQVSPGKYTVSASLAGFVTTLGVVTVGPRAAATIALDMPLEKIAQSVDVVAPSPISTTEGTIASTETIGGKDLDQYNPGGGLQASLRLLASIIEVPGGVSIKGGRPNQAGIQLGASTLIDPATGLAQLALPDDAIDSVAVLPNPYAVEYGRFSSGLVVIQTRRAGDQWKTRLNNIDPTFYTSRTNPFDVLGVGWWGPRLEVGGPLIKERLYLEQTAQFRYNATDIPSLPIAELKTAHSFSSFTRIDGTLSPRHSFVATGGVFPAVTDWATLGTFTPPPATVNLDAAANAAAFTERAVWTDSVFTETTVQAHDYVTDVLPQGSASMQLLPETTNGNFFNQQHRDTGLFQVISSLSGSRQMLGGLHLYKIGLDMLHSAYNGTSLSRDVLIERTDGTLARRLDFSPLPSVQRVDSTDVALFAQDRWQPATRWYTEFGLRLDRDGVVDRFNLTPRVGAALLLDDAGTSVIRGGYGLFYERTPSLAGAFNQFEPYTDTRFATDGSTMLAMPIAFVHRTADELQTPRSRTWDVSFEHRLSKAWSMHVAGIDREGRHELIVTPTMPTPTTGALLLESRGHSSYRGLEVGAHAAYGTRADLNVTYAIASAHADLNSLTSYFDAVMTPVVGQNQYTAANADVPNRVFVRGRYMPTDRWLVLGVFDWRSGMPYSNVNEYLDFVGPRNSLRFPTYVRLETGLERRFKILKFQPWIGIRIRNALNDWLPTDVQSNLSSPLYGTFYNSEYRQFRLQVRFER